MNWTARCITETKHIKCEIADKYTLTNVVN